MQCSRAPLLHLLDAPNSHPCPRVPCPVARSLLSTPFLTRTAPLHRRTILRLRLRLVRSAPRFIGFVRIFLGIGIGICFIAKPLYLSEIVPPKQRPTVLVIFSMASSIGMNSLYILDKTLSHTYAESWRVLLCAGGFPAAVLLVLLIFSLPESPHWLRRVRPETTQGLRDAEQREPLTGGAAGVGETKSDSTAATGVADEGGAGVATAAADAVGGVVSDDDSAPSDWKVRKGTSSLA